MSKAFSKLLGRSPRKSKSGVAPILPDTPRLARCWHRTSASLALLFCTDQNGVCSAAQKTTEVRLVNDDLELDLQSLEQFPDDEAQAIIRMWSTEWHSVLQQIFSSVPEQARLGTAFLAKMMRICELCPFSVARTELTTLFVDMFSKFEVCLHDAVMRCLTTHCVLAERSERDG